MGKDLPAVFKLYYGYVMKRWLAACLVLSLGSALFAISNHTASAGAPQPENPQDGPMIVQGVVPSDPPTQGATIAVPSNGQTFTNIPITVSGLCPRGLLVQIFRNNVFGGAVECTTGSYSLQVDLFLGQNELVAKVFDSLNQQGPDSNIVTVTFAAGSPGAGTRISLTTPFAKRGANPGSELSWPIIVTGGTPPYAMSVDWGDSTAPDLISQQTGGTVNIKHTYKQPGVYNVTVKATDARGDTAFLQLVGVGNGPIPAGKGGDAAGSTRVQRVVIWWPLLVLFAMMVSTFWLGKRHEIELIKAKLERGEPPFK